MFFPFALFQKKICHRIWRFLSKICIQILSFNQIFMCIYYNIYKYNFDWNLKFVYKFLKEGVIFCDTFFLSLIKFNCKIFLIYSIKNCLVSHYNGWHASPLNIFFSKFIFSNEIPIGENENFICTCQIINIFPIDSKTENIFTFSLL